MATESPHPNPFDVMKICRLYLCVVTLACFAPFISGAAQSPAYPAQPTTNPATAPATGTPTAAAVRVMRATRASAAINIDGKLDEPAWSTAVTSGDFTQSYPKIGAQPTDPSEVRVLYDDDAPGSALFFVWQQERSDFLPLEGGFRTRREIRQIFGRPGNVFLVKATYWFAR